MCVCIYDKIRYLLKLSHQRVGLIIAVSLIVNYSNKQTNMNVYKLINKTSGCSFFFCKTILLYAFL